MHIVFIVGNYYPNYSAVGKCVGNVADELSKTHKVTVICKKGITDQLIEETYNNQKIIRIITIDQKTRERLNEKINTSQGTKRKIYNFILYLYKMSQTIITILSRVTIKQDLVNKYLDALGNIDEQIDVVIPSSLPYESVIAAVEYKSNVSHRLKVIPYLFDQFANNKPLHRTPLILKLKFKNHTSLEKHVLANADFVLFLKQLEEHFISEFSMYKSKFFTVEPPLLREHPSLSKEKSDTFQFVYAGSFYKKIRNPEYFLTLFDSVLKEIKAKLDLYTFGNCEKIINNFSMKNKSIISNGKVTTENAYQAIQKADFLVAVGNSEFSQVPSKIYEYLSFGKPIIYFYSDNEDDSLKVLKKYPLALCLKQDKAIFNTNMVKLKDFCRENHGSLLPFEEIESLFITATPKYAANLIKQLITYE